jgi:DNA-binding response OmpR family regulator
MITPARRDLLRHAAAGMLSYAVACHARAAPPAMRFDFGGTEWQHRWSKAGQNEFTPKGQEDLAITSGEFSLLLAFVQNPHRPLSRQRLIELSRGLTSETDLRSMDVQVSRLRKLIEVDPRRPSFLQTVWGYGYVFVPEGKTKGL